MRAFEEDVRELAPEAAVVEEMRFEDYDGPVKDIERFRAHFNTLQLGKMIEVGLSMIQKQDLMLGKQDEMLQLQGEILKEVKNFNRKMGRLLEERLERLERDVVLTKSKLGDSLDPR